MSQVSVVICTYNRDKYLDLTLAGYLNQSYDAFEIIVIDDGGSDNTNNIIKKYNSILNINYLYQEHMGLSNARNIGLDLSNGKYIIITDSDRIPSPRFIEEHISLLRNNPSTVSIGRKHLVLSIFNQNLRLAYPLVFKFLRNNPKFISDFINLTEVPIFTPEDIAADFNRIINSAYLKEPRDNYRDVVDEYTEDLTDFHMGWAMATGGNVAFERNEKSLDIKFDENYRGWGLEDTDFFINCI